MSDKILSRKYCSGCGACKFVCTHDAISMVEKNGFFYPKIDSRRCTHCGKCMAVCPIFNANGGACEAAYVAKAKDEDLLKASTSGGIATLLGEALIDQGGVVFGAAWNENMNVRHIAADTKDKLALFHKSKYIQSDMSFAYPQMEKCLLHKKPVLFIGTPCQAEGVRQVFGDDENLITVSLICFGVGSPVWWQMRVKNIEGSLGELESFDFRARNENSGEQEIAFIAGKKEYRLHPWDDIFYASYAKGINLRPSCYACPFATMKRSTDISIGDAWGLEKDVSENSRHSLVLLHTEKGKAIWNEAKGEADYTEVSIDSCIQPRLHTATFEPDLRNFFFWTFTHLPEDVCMPFWKALRKIKSCIKRQA